MAEFVSDNLLLIGVVLLIALLVAFLLLRPRQRVRLTSEGVPQRPHLAHAARSRDGGRGLAAEAATAATDVAGEIFHAPVRDTIPAGSGPPDDLQQLKGVGPKFAEMLNARGITRFEQIARLTPDEVARLDAVLGPFRGRIERDRIVDQAGYLARGDVDGFEAKFGKL